MIAEILERAVAAGDPPAAQCCVIVDGDIVHQSAHGCELGSVFDLASVTKVAATTSALAWLVAREEIALEDTAQRYISSFAHPDVTLRALLGHRSGLPAWRPFFLRVLRDPFASVAFTNRRRVPIAAWARSRRIVLEDTFAAPLEIPGRRVYSDLGFITLGAIVETVTKERLSTFCKNTLHGGYDLGFVDLARGSSWLDGREVIPTGTTRPREPAPGQEQLYSVREHVPEPDAPEGSGRVDDDNAFAMGGVAGHAGLFGTARDLARFMYDAWIEDVLDLGAAREAFLAIDPAGEGPPRALGFDVATEGGSSGNFGEGSRVFGHLGFTGCSVWLDVDRRLSVVLLTNRTLHGRDRVEGIRALRLAFHDAVAATASPRTGRIASRQDD